MFILSTRIISQHWTIFKATENADLSESKAGSGRPRSALTDENINLFDELVFSQEDTPQSYNIVI